jgi:hypothetical protein
MGDIALAPEQEVLATQANKVGRDIAMHKCTKPSGLCKRILATQQHFPVANPHGTKIARSRTLTRIARYAKGFWVCS